MLKILLFVFLPLVGGESIFAKIDYKFTTPVDVVFVNTEEVSYLFGLKEEENFFVPGRLIFNTTTPVVQRDSSLCIKDKDLFMLFSDPEDTGLYWDKGEKPKLSKYKKFTTRKVAAINKRLYSRKMLYR